MSTVWLLMSVGRGPDECQLALTGLLDIVLAEARQGEVDCRELERVQGNHGPRSVLLALDGQGAQALAQAWQGTLCWTCPSPLRTGWGRKNWMVSASVLNPGPQEQDGAGELDPRLLKVETMRASGPGGQHVNRTESAVRITHLPTGIVASAQEERSQHRNRSLATARIRQALLARQEQAGQAAVQQRWSLHDQLERGNPVRTYRGPGFRRAD